MRDTQLDIYRALIMVYIVCVIHTIYWNGLFNDVIQSLILFEMPVVFFISGASQYVSNKDYNIIECVKNRAKRIIIPYYIFLAVIILSYYVLATFTDSIGKFHFSYNSLTAKDIIKMVLTGGCEKIPYLGYTWFISTYFIISCSLPVQKKIMKNIHPYIYLGIMALICLIMHFIYIPIGENEIKSIPVYNFFYIAGFLLYKRYYYINITAIILVMITFIMFITGIAIPMQDHKFPADFIFIIYGCTIISLLSLVFKYLNFKENTILRIWNQRGYTIYLYQAIPFFITYSICYKWKDSIESDILVFIAYFIFTFIFNTILSYMTTYLEKCVIRISKVKKDLLLF